MTKAEEALAIVVQEILQDPIGVFARQAYVDVLTPMPAAPNMPGEEVFSVVCSKVIPLNVEIVIIRPGKGVYLTPRNDKFFGTGWHFPGGCREPKSLLLEDCARLVRRELGDEIRITRATQIDFRDHPENPRFHDGCQIALCMSIGEPKGGEYFSEMPETLIAHHKKYWPIIMPYLT
ncbi:MAG TPA: NUDIX domain-containing protein [Candidatus Paceibacterota bacterium]